MILRDLCLALTVLALTVAPTASAAILYGHAGAFEDEANYGRLYRIDTDSQTVTPLGADTDRSYGTEIVASTVQGTLYFASVGWSDEENPYPSTLFQIDPATGDTLGRIAMISLPAEESTATAMEFVGSTLYGSMHVSGPESGDGILATISLTTGSVSELGAMTGMNRPTGGMVYTNGTMYAVSSTNNNDSTLYTVNLGTGAATQVAPITLDDVQTESVTALAAAGGKVYTFINRATNLYSIDLETGKLTLEFDTGVFLNSLASVPTVAPSNPIPSLSTIGMVLLAGLFLFSAGRRFATR